MQLLGVAAAVVGNGGSNGQQGDAAGSRSVIRVAKTSIITAPIAPGELATPQTSHYALNSDQATLIMFQITYLNYVL